jgi:hypothetical protein
MKSSLEDLYVGGKIILKWNLEGMGWYGLVQDREQ